MLMSCMVNHAFMYGREWERCQQRLLFAYQLEKQLLMSVYFKDYFKIFLYLVHWIEK